MKTNIKDFTQEELEEYFLSKLNEKKFHAKQTFEWIYKNVKSFDEMTNLSLNLRNKLNDEFILYSNKIIKKQVSVDGTIKYLFGLSDDNAIESVFMKYHHGNTVCVSSQVGCKMGCKFCASTGIGFIRNLTCGEIVEQLLAIKRDTNQEISNVVFMGIGEPLDNYENITKAISLINAPNALNIGARHISISTCGLVPKIYELAEKNLQCTLSISLHASNDKKRSELMPINNKYNIDELIKACKYYVDKTNRRISFEYALVENKNDTIKDAEELYKLLNGIIAHVNLIPINKVDGAPYNPTQEKNILAFKDYLYKKGLVATVRRRLGADIEAACGQLRRQNISKRKDK